MLTPEEIAGMQETVATAMPDTMRPLTPTFTTNAAGGREEGAPTQGALSACRIMPYSGGNEPRVSEQIRARAQFLLSYPTTVSLTPNQRIEVNDQAYEIIWVSSTFAWSIVGQALLVSL